MSFTAGAGNTAYTVTYTPQGGTATTVAPNPTASPVVLTGLVAGTTYDISVTPICATGTAAATTATFSTPLGSRSAIGGGVLTVYPNPAHHSFTLALPALGSVRAATVQVLNSLGQVVRTQTVATATTGTQTPVDITGLSAGIYTVRVRAGNDTAATRLAVE